MPVIMIMKWKSVTPDQCEKAREVLGAGMYWLAYTFNDWV